MTGMSRKLGLVLVLGAFAAAPSYAQDLQATFDQGVEAMQRGHDEEALRAFEQVLAADPSNEQAFQLFQHTEHDVWIQILSKQGDFELIAQRLMGLAKLGRLEHRDDADAIRALVAQVKTGDPVTSMSATRQLAAEHGEYAVPYLLPALADSGNEDVRVAAMVALSRMGLDVVLPLSAALDAPDAFLRRNVALTLGYLEDPRAVPMLSLLASSDSDTGVRQAAQEALTKIGAQAASPADAFVKAGQDYLERRDNVLSPYMYSDVVWRWEGRGLTKIEVPREIYPEMMARGDFTRALSVQPDSAAAVAGFVRAQVGATSKLARVAKAGTDVSGCEEYVQSGSVAVGYAGIEATDSALQGAVAAGDLVASQGLIDAVAAVAAKGTPGLQAALASDLGSLRSLAAIALAHLTIDSRGAASPEVVGELSTAVGRQIVRLAFVIDGDAQRAESIAADPRFADTPRVVITDDPDRAGELYGDKTAGIVNGADVSGVSELLGSGLNRDREEADRLSQAAAGALSDLASAGCDITGALGALAGTLATRPDAVAIPASHALERAGTGEQLPSLVAVVADSSRSDDVRSAAASAIAMIVARGAGSLSKEGVFTLQGVADSADATMPVRLSAARAVGVAIGAAGVRAEMITFGKTSAEGENEQ